MIHVEEVKPMLDRLADVLQKTNHYVTDESLFAYGVKHIGEPSLPTDLVDYPEVMKELLRRTGFLKWDVD